MAQREGVVQCLRMEFAVFDDLCSVPPSYQVVVFNEKTFQLEFPDLLSLDEPELHLGPKPDKVVPDLAGWRSERMPPEVDAEDELPYYDVAPDGIGEILSPRTEPTDRGKKMRIYRREGVKHLWLIHPIARTLEVYRLEGGRWLQLDTYEEDAVVRAEPFEAVEISLRVLWDGPPTG